MNILAWLFKTHLRIVYFFMKFNESRNKVTFISRLSNEPSIDFEMIKEELEKDKNIEIKIICKKIGKNYLLYYFNMYKQMYNISTSKVCIIDSYVPVVSILNHKKDLKVLQLWHSLGAIKKFGLQNLNLSSGRNRKLALSMNMHKNYDYIITASDETTKFFSKAFGYPKEKFLNYGLPRIDYLKSKKNNLKRKIYKKYPSLKKKETILYAPTFRRNEKNDKTLDIIDIVDFEKNNLIIKSHPLQKVNINNNNIYTCTEFSSMELLCVSDIVITDYSAIALEAYAINKKVYYYLYDLGEYKAKTGLNVDLMSELPSCCFKTKEELRRLIGKRYNNKEVKRYANKYLNNLEENSTKLIVNKVKEWIE